MNQGTTEVLRRCSCLIPHVRERKVLLLQSGGTWRLPSAEVTGTGRRNPTSALEQVLAQTVGPADVHLLRFMRLEKQERIWQCQNDDEGFRPPANGRWIAREELDGLDLADPTIRPLLETWFAEFGHAPPPGRAPWECQGWWQAPMQWIRQQLPPGDCPTVDRSHGGKTCSAWGYAVGISTAGRDLFFKATRDWNAHETRLTCVLANLFPANLPRLIAVDHTQGWMLLEDFGGHLREHGEPPGVLAEACRQLAQLQIDSTHHLSALACTDCPDLRDLEGERLAALFGDVRRAMEQGNPPPMSGADERIPAALSAATALLARARDTGIPYSIVHGDFGWINIGLKRSSGHYVLFDWGGGCIWHPLVDLARLAALVRQPSGSFVQSCLEPWTALVPMSRLVTAVTLAGRLTLVHSVWEYMRVRARAETWLADRISGWLAKTINDLAAGQS